MAPHEIDPEGPAIVATKTGECDARLFPGPDDGRELRKWGFERQSLPAMDWRYAGDIRQVRDNRHHRAQSVCIEDARCHVDNLADFIDGVGNDSSVREAKLSFVEQPTRVIARHELAPVAALCRNGRSSARTYPRPRRIARQLLAQGTHQPTSPATHHAGGTADVRSTLKLRPRRRFCRTSLAYVTQAVPTDAGNQSARSRSHGRCICAKRLSWRSVDCTLAQQGAWAWTRTSCSAAIRWP